MFVSNIFRNLLLRKSVPLPRCPFSSKFNGPIVLGIETSCDDTAAAIIDGSGKILAEKNHSQLQIHLDCGGVISIVARNLHNEYLDDIVYDTLQSSGLSMDDVTLVAVTNRPGLPLSLCVGLDYAKKLAIKYRKPLIPIHHMEAHATMASLFDPTITFPFLSLLISGGHAQLAYFQNLNKIYLLGETIDDAPGDVMDKIARRLRIKNLGSPYDTMSGGAAIEILAKDGRAENYPITVPIRVERNCNFSFSAFNSVISEINILEKASDSPVDQPLPQLYDICAAVLSGVTVHILQRLTRAIEFIEGTKLWKDDWEPDTTQYRIDYISEEEPLNLKVVVSGGVACNDFVIDNIKDYFSNYDGVYETTKVTAHTPRPKKWCSDNAVMIAWNGLLQLRENSSSILKSEKDINLIDIEPKAQLGINISDYVTKANIKPRKIKLKNN